MDFPNRYERALNEWKDVVTEKLVSEKPGIKWYILLNLNFRKAANPEKFTDPYVTFKSQVFSWTNVYYIDHMFESVPDQIFSQIEDYRNKRSDWLVDHFLNIDFWFYGNWKLWSIENISM